MKAKMKSYVVRRGEPRPVKMSTAIRLILELRRHHNERAMAPPRIRISSNKDRQMVKAACMGRVAAYEDVIRILARVK